MDEKLWKLEYDYQTIGLTMAEYIEMKNLQRMENENRSN